MTGKAIEHGLITIYTDWYYNHNAAYLLHQKKRLVASFFFGENVYSTQGPIFHAEQFRENGEEEYRSGQMERSKKSEDNIEKKKEGISRTITVVVPEHSQFQ